MDDEMIVPEHFRFDSSIDENALLRLLRAATDPDFVIRYEATLPPAQA